MHGVKFSFLNEIPNIHILFEKCYICEIWSERMRLKILILINEINLFLWE